LLLRHEHRDRTDRTQHTGPGLDQNSCDAPQITFVLVVNNAMQGILSSFFFKYADTILKKYSSTVATLVTGLLSAALFSHKLTMNFCIGVTIVGISMHQFFSQGALTKREC